MTTYRIVIPSTGRILLGGFSRLAQYFAPDDREAAEFPTAAAATRFVEIMARSVQPGHPPIRLAVVAKDWTGSPPRLEWAAWNRLRDTAWAVCLTELEPEDARRMA